MTDPSPTDTDGSPSTTPKKTQLFCPACPYTAPIDGGWRLEERTAGLTLRCPVCGAVVVCQPTPRLLAP